MTDKNYTHITVLIDSSGSMASLANDTRGGFNTFLAEQKAVKGKATLTVCKFSTGYEVLTEMADIQMVAPLTEATYSPGGGTALLDAMGRCISSLGVALADLPEKKRPSKIMFLVITDGEENSSHEYSKAKIASMVSLQEKTYKWNFVYLGANVDSFAESASLGMRSSNALNYSPTSGGVGGTYQVLSKSMTSVRGVGEMNTAYDLFSNVANVEEAVGLNFDAIVGGSSSAASSLLLGADGKPLTGSKVPRRKSKKTGS